MTWEFKRLNLIGSMFNVIFILLSLFFLELDERYWPSVTMFLYIFSLFFNIWVLKKINGKTFTYFSFVYLISELFHLSQIFLAVIKEDSSMNIFHYLSMDDHIKSFTFSFICIEVMLISYLLMNKKVSRIQSYNDITKGEKKLISLIFAMSFVLKVYFKVSSILLANDRGYTATLDGDQNVSFFISVIANIFGILFLLHCASEKNKRLIFWGLVVFEVFSMMSGSRIYSVSYLVLLFAITSDNIFLKSDNQISKKNKNKSLSLVLLAVLLLILLVGIRFAREVEGGVKLANIYRAVSEHNIFVEIIKEFGATQLDTSVAVHADSIISHFHGVNYLKSFLSVFPNIGGVFGDYINDLKFTYQLRHYFYWSYGGSFVCESYMSFGYFGVIFFIIVGWAFGKTNRALESITSRSIIDQVFYIGLAYCMIIWIRGYFFIIVRTPIWLTILYAIISSIILRKKIKLFVKG